MEKYYYVLIVNDNLITIDRYLRENCAVLPDRKLYCTASLNCAWFKEPVIVEYHSWFETETDAREAGIGLAKSKLTTMELCLEDLRQNSLGKIRIDNR